MSTKKQFSLLLKPVKKTYFVPDPEQLPFDIDHIVCPKCNKMQVAQILHDWPVYRKIHQCIECGYRILEDEWKSIQ